MVIILINIFNGSFDLIGTLYMLPGLVLALTVHEYSHARMSDKLGDPTPERQGRLTLNPLAHMDPVGTICLLFAGFGWGKPVEIDPTYYRNPAKDSAKVAAAGPISNFILSFVSLVIAVLLMIVPSQTQVIEIIMQIFIDSAYLNLGLGLFNLLPFPPLDGSKILRYFLRGKALEFMYTLERYSYIIILILYITKIPSYILTPLMNWIMNGMLWVILKIISIFL